MAASNLVNLALTLTPHGRLIHDALTDDGAAADTTLAVALERDNAGLLLDLAARRPEEPLHGGLGWFRDLARTLLASCNLTAATHVVHFDRWWNPAVEDQATDRAFRIGQKRAVFVHKMVCRGTVEERVDELIHGKRKLASELLGGAADEVRLTELSDAELLATVSLDLSRARLDS